MKKQFLLILSIIICTVSFAQKKISSTTKSSTSFGVRAGLTSSGIRGDAATNFDELLSFSGGAITTKMLSGFYAGGYAIVKLTEGLTLEPGVFYAEKGYELVGELNVKGVGFLGANAKAKLQLQYIDVPLLLKANVGSSLQVFAGPQFSYLVKGNLHSTAGLLGINILNNDMDVTKQFNQWDAGITGGIGYKLTNGINISASYDYGLSKIDKNQNTNAYNHAFKVGIGIDL